MTPSRPTPLALREQLHQQANERTQHWRVTLSHADPEQLALTAAVDVASELIEALYDRAEQAERTAEEYRGVIETYGMIQTTKCVDTQTMRVALTVDELVFFAATDPAELFVSALRDCIEQLRREHAARHARRSATASRVDAL